MVEMKAYWKNKKMHIELDSVKHVLNPKEAYEFYSIYKSAVEGEFFRKVLELDNKYNVR